MSGFARLVGARTLSGLAIPGLTFAGVIALAVLVMINRWRPLPAWLRAGIRDFATDRSLAMQPVGLAGAA